MAIHELADPTFELPEAGIAGRNKAATFVDESGQSDQLQQYPFSDEELEQFQSDDAAAGRTIGKMLATLFTYTVIIMSVVIWWTLTTVWNR